MTVLTIVHDTLVQKMLAAHLQQMGLLVIWEGDIAKACAALQSVTPDLIILDFASTTGNQHGFVEHLYALAQNNAIPIIILTEKNDRSDSRPAYPSTSIAKPFAPRLLRDLVRTILQKNSTGLHEGALRAGGIQLNPLTCRVNHGQTEIRLRPKEFRLLAFLMKHVDRVFNRNQLLDEIWGTDTFIDERTVDVIIRRLRAALEPYDLANRIETIRGSGYRFRV